MIESKPGFVKNKIKTQKKGRPLARARAYRPGWHSKKVTTPKVIKSIMDAFDANDIQASVRVLREAMNATVLMWDIKEKKYIERPDHKTRLKAAALVIAYIEGLPVQRQIQVQATGGFEELGDVVNRIRANSEAMRAVEDIPEIHAMVSVPDSLQIGPSVTSDEKPFQGNIIENEPLPPAQM